METNTFRLPSGHEFTESPLTPITIYTESEVDYVDRGNTVFDNNGKAYLITEVRFITGRLYRIVMLPLEVQA